jgi:hypothetical protein
MNRTSILVASALCTLLAWAQRAPLFKSEILPIFETNCVKCHRQAQKMAGLDLSTFSGLMAGGSSGPVIVPGNAQRSLLWKMIELDKMPMGGKLSAADKQSIKAYIEQGRFPAMNTAELDRQSQKITPEARAWWSFRKPVKPTEPAITNGDQVCTPIDKFILAQLEGKGWKLQPEADRITLIRRASFDLTGLPPTSAEVKAFVEDRSPNAYEALIDRLLASPHYGEQWGRHWLDIAG